MKSRGRNTLVEKSYDVVAYLLDIAYDIAIPPVTKVSKNPGIESWLGIYSTDWVYANKWHEDSNRFTCIIT